MIMSPVHVNGDDDVATTGRSSILVVDDEAVLRTLVKEVLSSDGYDVTAVAGGEEAVELINRTGFDLIITDVVMPGVNGVQVLRAAKRVDPNYPVVMITGFPSTDAVRKMIKLGAFDHMVKPFNVDLLKLTVAKVLEMRRQLDLASRKGSAQVPAIDSVTGVYNLRAFVDLLEAEIGRSERRGHVCSLLAIRIDGLHARVSWEGQFLKQFVKVLKDAAQPGDMIGRTDEKDFAVILPETTREEAEIRSQKVFNMGDLWPVSAGIACFPRDASDAEGLAREARAAMAKYD